VARLESGPPRDLFLGSPTLSLVPANDMKEAVTAANAGARPLKGEMKYEVGFRMGGNHGVKQALIRAAKSHVLQLLPSALGVTSD